ncbi:MAG: hypothetical protein LBN29_03165 [Mediterranea sp.]|jgi:hypothetical protein|nr:hypothetical protein [Mediterranea sp.]
MFVWINSLLKLSFWKLWQVCLFAALCAAFVVITCPWVTGLSKTQLAGWLATPAVMRDVAVWITLETTLCVAFCFAELRADGLLKRATWRMALARAYPGLLIFPVLLYSQARLIFAMPGTGFATLSYSLAAVVLVGLPLLSRLPAWIAPEKEFRLELHFLVSLFVCGIGLIATASGSVTYQPVHEPVNIRAIALSAALFAAFFVAGAAWNKIKWNIKKGNTWK